MKNVFFILLLLVAISTNAQKDSLNIGDRYSDDQLYVSISYGQLFNQPSEISKSGFSYALSAGYMKDVILTKKGNVSFAFGIGYGIDYYNHQLKVDEIGDNFIYTALDDSDSNTLTLQNIEFPLEFRWRTSTANKYNFWRIYSGVKFLYNVSNVFRTQDENGTITFKNIPSFNQWQYGLTLSLGYDAFNFNVFYNLTPILNDSFLNGEIIETSTLKFGFIFYIL